jgi:hypothetical protein
MKRAWHADPKRQNAFETIFLTIPTLPKSIRMLPYEAPVESLGQKPFTSTRHWQSICDSFPLMGFLVLPSF